ncbi:MAG: hypothetical protein ABWZ25_04320 [Chitinophagaceae bacterium]
MMNYWFLLIPFLTAITGMICVQLPFLLLFRPVRPFRFFGTTFQGIFPALQSSVASQAGLYVSQQFPLDVLENKINDPANFERIRPMIEVHIDDFLRNKLKEQMPMISMFIGDKTIVSLKTVFINEIADLFPRIMAQFAGNLRSEFNIQELVTGKILAIDPVKAREVFESKTRKPLGKLAVTGFFVGLIIGLLQLLLICLLVR